MEEQPNIMAYAALFERAAAREALAKYASDKKTEGAYIKEQNPAYINQSFWLVQSLNEVLYYQDGKYIIGDNGCTVTLYPRKNTIIDDTIWKSKFFNSPGKGESQYHFPDDGGYVLTAEGMPFGLFQQFDTTIEWDSPSVKFDSNGVPITKNWPFSPVQ